MKPELRWGDGGKQASNYLYCGELAVAHYSRTGRGPWRCYLAISGLNWPAPENTRESAMAELERVTREMLRDAAGE